MDPKDKAKALIIQYMTILFCISDMKERHFFAKECALIAVDEILASHFKKYKGYGEKWDYCQQVKEAIQNED
jgi:hypothetical protein